MRRILAFLSVVILILLLAGRAELSCGYGAGEGAAQTAGSTRHYSFGERSADALQAALEQTSGFLRPAGTTTVASAAARSLPVRVWRRAFPFCSSHLPDRFSVARQSGTPDRALSCYNGCTHTCRGTGTPGDYYIYMLRRIVI